MEIIKQYQLKHPITQVQLDNIEEFNTKQPPENGLVPALMMTPLPGLKDEKEFLTDIYWILDHDAKHDFWLGISKIAIVRVSREDI